MTILLTSRQQRNFLNPLPGMLEASLDTAGEHPDICLTTPGGLLTISVKLVQLMSGIHLGGFSKQVQRDKF